jgi:hypothetical protein
MPGKKAERPAPLVAVVWHAGEHADAADVDVAEVDMPAFVVGVVVGSAGESGRGHVVLIARERSENK